MVEAAKKAEGPEPVVTYNSNRTKVLDLSLRDSVELPPAPPQTRLVARREEGRPHVGQTPALDMELDRALGGVVVRYTSREDKRTYLVPLGNIKAMKLE